jgi:hypothetical protein
MQISASHVPSGAQVDGKEKNLFLVFELENVLLLRIPHCDLSLLITQPGLIIHSSGDLNSHSPWACVK